MLEVLNSLFRTKNVRQTSDKYDINYHLPNFEKLKLYNNTKYNIFSTGVKFFVIWFF